MPSNKRREVVLLSDEEQELLETTSRETGLSKSAILRLALLYKIKMDKLSKETKNVSTT